MLNPYEPKGDYHDLYFTLLTLILLEPKVIRLCHQYRAVQSDQTQYCWLTNFKFSSLYP